MGLPLARFNAHKRTVAMQPEQIELIYPYDFMDITNTIASFAPGKA